MQVCKKFILGTVFCLSVVLNTTAQEDGSKQWDKNDLFAFHLNNSNTITTSTWNEDSVSFPTPFTRQLTIENRPEYIFPTNSFLRGENEKQDPIRNAFSVHMKYSFQSYPNSYTDRIYGRFYQGIGLARYFFGNKKELGNPLVIYLFQGGRIRQFASFLSLNYEWNIGLSFGWNPYDSENNPNNRVIGSKTNAYVSTDLYLNWTLSPKLDLTSGITLTHFSNGNTKYPNNGLNTTGGKLGLVYNFNRNDNWETKEDLPPIKEFPRHMSFDLVFFGSGCRTGVDFKDGKLASPELYPVLGFYFAPMYNTGYKFRAGISIDGTYNGSANIYTHDYLAGSQQKFFDPPIEEQLAIGISARADYVMPYFTVSLGVGKNIIHGGGDMNIYYQSLALKIELTRNSYLNIGYSLQDFHNPNFLMLGIGFRFNNKYPSFYR